MDKNISDFFKDEYVNSAVYIAYRSIGNYVDGQKPSSRKVIYTIDKFNIKDPIKVAQLQSKSAENTEYLHNEAGLSDVIVKLGATYVGNPEVNLLVKKGNFGTRFKPAAAAERYIYVNKSKWFDKVFIKEDFPLLKHQTFEGSQIEPKYYVPVIPLILVNGNEGIGTGFSQIICSRSLKEISSEIKKYLKDPSYHSKGIKPYYTGWNGKIEVKNGKVYMHGKIDRLSAYQIKITEIPIGYSLSKYREILDTLEDKKVIKSYEDFSERDKFEFVVTVGEAFGKQTDEKILLDLLLTIDFTENFTCIDENNKVREFKNEVEILESFIKIRLDYYDRRKAHLLSKWEEEIKVSTNRYKFVSEIISGKIVINNKSKKDVESQLTGYYKVEGSYDYLMKMSLWSLTTEKLAELKKELDARTKQIEDLKNKDNKMLWIEDLDELLKVA